MSETMDTIVHGGVRLRTVQFTLAEAIETARLDSFPGASSRKLGGGWHGESFADAMRMAEHGDKASALKLKLGARASIRPMRRSIARWGEAGSTVDVARFLSGEPENMIETMRARRPSAVIRLAIERCVHSGTPPNTMRITGASVLTAVEGLRTSGVPAEIWSTFTTSGKITLSIQILIQQAGRPIDIDRLAYWVVNPSALRRVAFSIMEKQPEDICKAIGIKKNGGYGMPTPVNPQGFDEVAPAREDQVTAWISDVLKRRAGVELLPGRGG